MDYVDIYGIQEAETVIRGTLRNLGWCSTWKRMVDMGLIEDIREDLGDISYADYLAHILGEELQEDLIKVIGNDFLDDSSPEEKEMVSGFIERLDYLGLFDEEIMDGSRDRVEILAHILEGKLKYGPGERDMILLLHEIVAHIPDKDENSSEGSFEKISCYMAAMGKPGGDSAMSRTVGLPAAMAVDLILQGKICDVGVHRPITSDLYAPILELLAHEGLKFTTIVEKFE